MREPFGEAFPKCGRKVPDSRMVLATAPIRGVFALETPTALEAGLSKEKSSHPTQKAPFRSRRN